MPQDHPFVVKSINDVENVIRELLRDTRKQLMELDSLAKQRKTSYSARFSLQSDSPWIHACECASPPSLHLLSRLKTIYNVPKKLLKKEYADLVDIANRRIGTDSLGYDYIVVSSIREGLTDLIKIYNNIQLITALPETKIVNDQ